MALAKLRPHQQRREVFQGKEAISETHETLHRELLPYLTMEEMRSSGVGPLEPHLKQQDPRALVSLIRRDLQPNTMYVRSHNSRALSPETTNQQCLTNDETLVPKYVSLSKVVSWSSTANAIFNSLGRMLPLEEEQPDLQASELPRLPLPLTTSNVRTWILTINCSEYQKHETTSGSDGSNTNSGLGNNQNTGYASRTTTAGPHSSNLANKADPRIDSDLDNSRTVGSGVAGSNSGYTGTQGSSYHSGPSGTAVGGVSASIHNGPIWHIF